MNLMIFKKLYIYLVIEWDNGGLYIICPDENAKVVHYLLVCEVIQ